MNLPNRQIKKQIGLVGVIFGSLLLAFPAVAQMNPTMPENMNTTPGNQKPENDGLSPVERSRLCAERINSTTLDRQNSSPINRQNPTSRNNNQPASIIETLPSGSVSEPPAVRDGRIASPTQSDAEQICSNYRTERQQRASNSLNYGNKQLVRQNSYSAPLNSNQTTVIPTPEQQQAATTSVSTVNGVVNLRLVNNSGADIAYQVIGDTQPRYLTGNNSVTLSSINTPTSLTFYRPDRGFLIVTPQPVSPGVLEVIFNPTSNFSLDKTTMTVQPSGAVYLN
ncbi:hypothetical protein IQ264_21550 [Phormidium sp. LEGE 05292]|uniref:hypothetical protein n=1 Tax=[Phormidium] sp. LEGE 05292 TaxID=767427 RepID=UPI0018828FA9|nr:hypothetical protein [Phormidium sp. LEGE 05292]MBE9228012.1 hypothetical protein [Phormidium sp. LEGE 05292]